MILENILSLINQYGYVAAFFTIIAGMLFFVARDFFKRHKEGHSDSTQKEEDGYNIINVPIITDENMELTNHPLFSTLKFRINVEIPSLNFSKSKPVRQSLYRNLLSLFLKSIENSAKSISALENKMDLWSIDEWVQKVSDIISKSYYQFNQDALADGIPIEVLNLFNNWNQLSVKILFDYLTNLSTSSLYSSNKSRTNTLFVVMGLIVVTSIADAEKTLKYLNGEISGKYYKGQVLE